MEEINVGYKFKQIRENAGLTLKQVRTVCQFYQSNRAGRGRSVLVLPEKDFCRVEHQTQGFV